MNAGAFNNQQLLEVHSFQSILILTFIRADELDQCEQHTLSRDCVTYLRKISFNTETSKENPNNLFMSQASKNKTITFLAQIRYK